MASGAAHTAAEPAAGGAGGGPSAAIIFARLPVLGQVKRRLAAAVGARLALDLYSACVRRVLPPLVSALHEAGMQCFLFWASPPSEPGHPSVLADAHAQAQQWAQHLGLHHALHLRPQIESGDLGERMAAALDSVLRQGFQKAVIVGTDIPDLSASSVLSALRALDSFQVVFGPAADGGYYLVGVRGQSAPSSLFQGVRWSTSTVLSDSLRAVQAAGLPVAPTGTLPELQDIDTVDDLAKWYSIASAAAHRDPVSPPDEACQALLHVSKAVLEERELLQDALSSTGYTFN